MEISNSDWLRTTPEQQRKLDAAIQSFAFQQRLEAVRDRAAAVRTDGSVAPISAGSLGGTGAAARDALATVSVKERELRDTRFNHNGEDVSFDELPADVQQWFKEIEEKSARDRTYRAQVANDPNVGPVAKLRPFDAELDGWAMKRLAAMEPSTAQMTPQEYYNYMGSDREKYDGLIRAAESPAYDSSKRIFGVDLEQESKVQLIRDLRAQGEQLPQTYAEFEQTWLSDLARQQALTKERQHLLETGEQIKG